MDMRLDKEESLILLRTFDHKWFQFCYFCEVEQLQDLILFTYKGREVILTNEDRILVKEVLLAFRERFKNDFKSGKWSSLNKLIDRICNYDLKDYYIEKVYNKYDEKIGDIING